MRIYIDFETRSQADIWNVGAHNYAYDETTEILCVCFAIENSPVTRINLHRITQQDVDGMRTLVALANDPSTEFHAHNAFFERQVWAAVFHPKFRVPVVGLNRWRCTAAKANAHALPRSLEKCALALNTDHQKDMSGSRHMKRLAGSTGPIEQADMDRLIAYCEIDVLVERDIDRMLPDLPPIEQRAWFMDQYINDFGVMVDLPIVRKAAHFVRLETEKLTAELNALTGGEITAGTQRDAIKGWLEKRGLVLPNLQKETVRKALESEKAGIERRVLSLRRQLSNISNAKYDAMLGFTSPDGRMRDTLVYHGASTGRFTGKAVQVHNLPKPKFDNFDALPVIDIIKNGTYEDFSMIYEGVALDTLSSCIRGMFIPTGGCEMYGTDFAAIEARVVLWLAGDEKGVKMFQSQDADPAVPDIYVQMARKIYKNEGLTKKDKAERNLGKTVVLGCGFGLGPGRFNDACDEKGVDLGARTRELEQWGKKIMVAPLAAESVYGYREMFPAVPAFWRNMEDAARKAVLQPGQGFQVGRLIWYTDKHFLRLLLPSGRSLSYHRPSVNNEGKVCFWSPDPVTKQYRQETTWGGTLVENAVQAVARDIMLNAMETLIGKGHRILFTVHDELVTETKIGATSTEEVVKHVCQLPSWATGCPVNAESEKTTRYKK